LNELKIYNEKRRFSDLPVIILGSWQAVLLPTHLSWQDFGRKKSKGLILLDLARLMEPSFYRDACQSWPHFHNGRPRQWWDNIM